MNDEIQELSEKLRVRYTNFLEDKIKINYFYPDELNEFVMEFPFLDRSNDYIQIYIEVDVENGKNVYYLSDEKETLDKFRMSGSDELNLTDKFKNIIKRNIKQNNFNLEHFEKYDIIYVKVNKDKLVETLHSFLQVLIILNNIEVQDLK